MRGDRRGKRTVEYGSLELCTIRKPVRRVQRITPERAAELLERAKQAEIVRAHYDGGTFIDYTAAHMDKYYGVK